MRVLIVMAAHWPRALIRATLREAGYDALGARDLDEALTYPEDEAGRGPVRLILLDQPAIQGEDDPRLAQLLRMHPRADPVLLRSALQPSLAGPWRAVLQHPLSIADLSERVCQLLPLPSPAGRPGA